ncbi:hypothetical protein PCIT_a2476 [Pseudoalteromonas citrea]|uniref:TIGR02444 family protein n=2 Tax=Pseudoalteromonas citrea TaxID=43655 RepID=A0AAD4AJT8_9GAMM|nr:TIGR02444 family protein [Pseudoalteromonas citrea]KAF7772413.1 hypothetical protein PCIT_a2476 [Pseudoalteromonas citrea]
MKTPSAAEFWHFSCEVYALTGVQPHLLSLQDLHNKNVNLCLLLLYLEKHQVQLSLAQGQMLESLCRDIDAQLLIQHRLLRQTLKSTYRQHPSYHDVRAQLLDSELALEKFQQSLLIEALSKTELCHDSTPNNLCLYLDKQSEQSLRLCCSAHKT